MVRFTLTVGNHSIRGLTGDQVWRLTRSLDAGSYVLAVANPKACAESSSRNVDGAVVRRIAGAR